MCQLLLCWELEYFRRALFNGTELEMDCRQWLVLPRCTNSELPFSISVFSITGEHCWLHFLLWGRGLQVVHCHSDISLLPPSTSVCSIPSSRLLAGFACFCLFFNCLDFSLHEIHACDETECFILAHFLWMVIPTNAGSTRVIQITLNLIRLIKIIRVLIL